MVVFKEQIEYVKNLKYDSTFYLVKNKIYFSQYKLFRRNNEIAKNQGMLLLWLLFSNKYLLNNYDANSFCNLF